MIGNLRHFTDKTNRDNVMKNIKATMGTITQLIRFKFITDT